MYRIDNLQVALDKEGNDLRIIAAEAMKVPVEAIAGVSVVKKSLDARRKNNVHFVYTLDVMMADQSSLEIRGKTIRAMPNDQQRSVAVIPGEKNLEHRPVIVGAGPAGLFAALTLSDAGYCPLLIERGKQVEERIIDVGDHWKDGRLDIDSNVAFGEGGAGTFSDGKLTTRIKNDRVRIVLEQLVEAGAPKEIMYEHKPHVGTDHLQKILKQIREKLLKSGCDIRYSTKMNGINFRSGAVRSITVNDNEEIPCQVLLLCIGHSARDTYFLLQNEGLLVEPKPFAIGLRIEHPQVMIDEIQYGRLAGHSALPPAEYQMACQTSDGRGVYSFCMCPGGFVIGASTEEEHLVINGMSQSKRASANANAALVCTVDHRDMSYSNPMAGIEFQRKWEYEAFVEGGGGFTAPVQNIKEFLTGDTKRRIHTKLVMPSYLPGVEAGLLHRCLPESVVNALKEGVVSFNKKMPGFSDSYAVLTGVETRTSAPVRITRDPNKVAVKHEGVYPVGEGAGYAGGIVSAAVDGIESAEAVICKYSRPIKLTGQGE